MILVSTSCRWI